MTACPSCGVELPPRRSLWNRFVTWLAPVVVERYVFGVCNHVELNVAGGEVVGVGLHQSASEHGSQLWIDVQVDRDKPRRVLYLHCADSVDGQPGGRVLGELGRCFGSATLDPPVSDITYFVFEVHRERLPEMTNQETT